MKNLSIKKQQIKEAKKALYNSKVIAFPTETVMGLGVLYDDYNAYELLNKIKNRREDKPYTMMVKDITSIEQYAFVDEKINRLIKTFMPGSLTLLLKAKDNVPDYVTHNTGVIGIRIPSNPEALELLKEVDKPLLVPSANKAGEKPAYNDKEVKEIFLNELGYIISGCSKSNIPSTIVDVSNGEPVLIREGAILFKDILEVYHG